MINGGNLDFTRFYSTFSDQVIMTYKGPFDKNIIGVFNSYIHSLEAKYPSLGKKIYSVFVELAQNISYYSAERTICNSNQEVGIGALAIGESDDEFFFYSGNAVKNEHIEIVADRCNSINDLDKEGLRKFRREQLNLPSGEHDTAHIGLIQIALTSCNPLEMSLIKLNSELSYFTLKVKINK